jgi:putative membrane protein insertion efficiency factor/ribonuclease P protein component
MLPSRYRLHTRRDISAVIRHGRRARRGTVVVHVRVGDDPEISSRAAFAVSKSVGDSVTRHRVIRRLRAIMPHLLDRLPGGTDVVVRAMPEAAGARSTQLREDLEAALERVTPLGPPSTECASVDMAILAPPRTGIGRVLAWIGWPVRSLLIGLVWVYRQTISPILPPTCRYHPSCSAYGFEALKVHGAAKGTALTAWRVMRCNPFSDGGLDPVPARGAWRPDIHPDGTPRVAMGPVA